MPGIFDTSLAGHEQRTPQQAIGLAAEQGFEALMFGNVAAVFPGLDPAALAAAATAAKAAGVRLAAGAGIYNPARPGRNPALISLGNGDVNEGMARLLRAMPALGVDKLFFVVGMIEDRDDPDVPWTDQIAGVVAGVRALAPAIRESGVRLLIKTHEEISSFEILKVIEAVGADLLGIAHDPVNVACRLEDAVACTRRIASHVAQLHVDDAFLTFDGDRMRRYLTPMGSGDVDWPAILALLPEADLWVELHRGQFAMPVFDRDWVAAQPDASLDEYRSLVGAAVRRLRRAESVPDQIGVYARVPGIVDWLRARGSGRVPA